MDSRNLSSRYHILKVAKYLVDGQDKVNDRRMQENERAIYAVQSLHCSAFLPRSDTERCHAKRETGTKGGTRILTIKV